MGYHTDVIKELLERGADPDKYHGRTPLHEAARRGQRDTAQLLLRMGADPNIVDDDEKSPLYWAALRGHEEMVRLLSEGGADPSVGDAWEVLEWRGQVIYTGGGTEQASWYLPRYVRDPKNQSTCAMDL